MLVFNDPRILEVVIMKRKVYCQAPYFAVFQIKIGQIIFSRCLVPRTSSERNPLALLAQFKLFSVRKAHRHFCTKETPAAVPSKPLTDSDPLYFIPSFFRY